MIEQALGDQMHDSMFARAFHLQSPGHAEQATAEQKSALATRQIIEDHDVGAGGFVFQRDKLTSLAYRSLCESIAVAGIMRLGIFDRDRTLFSVRKSSACLPSS